LLNHWRIKLTVKGGVVPSFEVSKSNKMSYLQTSDGTRLFYQDLETGKPIVFVHGWCISSDSWEYVINELPQQGIRVIVYDQRGCDRSDKPVTGYDYTTLAQDLQALLEHLNLSDVTLVGHSLGCGVIARYLSHFNMGRVVRSVWIAPTTPFPLLTSDNPEGIEEALFTELLRQIRTDRAAYVQSLAHSFFAGPLEPLPVSQSLLEWGLNITMSASPFAATGMFYTCGHTDQREEIKTIQIPVLLLHGALDLSAPLHLTSKKNAELLPNATLKVYPEGAHGYYMVDGPQIRKDILEFMLL
jgi:non-heme chloroperoxidase